MKEINGMDNTEFRNISSANSFHDDKHYPRIFIVISSFALFLHIFVIVLMLRNKKLRQRPANKFLLNLLISDAIICILFMSYAGRLLAIWDDQKSFFEHYFTLPTLDVFFYVIIVSSMLNFTLITVDRLIAVKWPFFYEDRIHTKQSLICIAVVWVITISYAIVMITVFNVLDPRTSKYLGKIMFVVIITTGFIALLITNSFVFVEAKRQLRATEKITHRIETITAEPSVKSNNAQRELWKKKFRLVRINIGLILCFFLFWTNLVILFIRLLVCANEKEPPIRVEYILASWYLAIIYYICNPLWYVALSYDVKREVKQLFIRKQSGRNNSLLP